MGKFIVGTFLILGFVFYELSGGADFVPESSREQVAEVVQEPEVEAVPEIEVSRASTTTLVNVAPEPQVPEAEVLQAVLEVVEAEPIVTEPAPEPEVAEVEPAPEPLDLRLVAGSRVNMRAGPGTNFDVLDTLDGGTQTEVIEVSESGWARIRVTTTGQIGWMAERLLSES